MSMPGMGVMIGMLGGNEDTVAAYNASVGKTISGIEIADDELRISFDGGYRLIAKDEGQSCCEHRYMRTDDDLQHFIGAILTGLEIKEAPDEKDEYGEHEVQFLEVKTDRGVFTVANHNEHNGYYGGFWITLHFGETPMTTTTREQREGELAGACERCGGLCGGVTCPALMQPQQEAPGAVEQCKCIDCYGTEPGHSDNCGYMRELHGQPQPEAQAAVASNFQETSMTDTLEKIVADWRGKADKYVEQADEKDPDGRFRWAKWLRDELSAKASVCSRDADKLEAALQAGEAVAMWRAMTASGKWMYFDHEPTHMPNYQRLYTTPPAPMDVRKVKALLDDHSAGKLHSDQFVQAISALYELALLDGQPAGVECKHEWHPDPDLPEERDWVYCPKCKVSRRRKAALGGGGRG